MKKVHTALVTAGVLTALLGGGVIEATAQPTPIIGCVKPGTGLLRIPPAGEGCKDQETPLGFNDLPLLVALRQRIVELEKRVQALEECPAIVEECSEKNGE